MEGIQICGLPTHVQINIEGPTDWAQSIGGSTNSSTDIPSEDSGNGPSHAMKLLIAGLAEMAIAGGSTFQTASALPKPFFITYVSLFLALAVLDLALLVLLCKGGGQALTKFAKWYAVVMMVLALLLLISLKAYMAFEN